MPGECSHFTGHRHFRAPLCSRSFVFCFCCWRYLETGLSAQFATKLALRRRFKVPSPLCASRFPLVIGSPRRRRDTLFETGECFETSNGSPIGRSVNDFTGVPAEKSRLFAWRVG